MASHPKRQAATESFEIGSTNKNKMKKLEKKRLETLRSLKNSKTSVPGKPSASQLESFENSFSERDYVVEFVCPEFTSLCPVTGQPDFGKIVIRYVPDTRCIESKSLKLFLFAFRNHETFHEEAVNLILEAVQEACSPRRAEVEGEFHPRGGISIHVKAKIGER